MKTDTQKNQTKGRLIEAGLHLFGRKGFEGTSTRELAARAETNIASIAYHFGGKAGLRVACANTVTQRIGTVLTFQDDAVLQISRQDALERIERMLTALVRLMVSGPQTRDMVAFMLRELTDPGEIADMVYADFLEAAHMGFCDLWAAATGQAAQADEVKLAVFAAIGQVLYFRIAAPFVQRRLGWDQTGEKEAQDIADIVVSNVRGIIKRQQI